MWQFDTTFGRVVYLTGYYLLGVGIAGVLFVPSARVWGKRHLFLLGAVLLIASNVWAGATRCRTALPEVRCNYNSLLWARIIQGVGTAPFEALVNVSVGDLYFVHVSSKLLTICYLNLLSQERGKRMALTNLAVYGGAFCTPILVGKITKTIGWHWTFYFTAIFCSACLPALIFFVPETAYRRSAHLNTDFASSEDLALDPKQVELRDQQHQSTNVGQIPEATKSLAETKARSERDTEDVTNRGSTTNQEVPKKMSYIQSLKPFSGRKTDDSFWKLFLRPFPLFAHPAILWACLTQGTLIGWTVFIGTMLGAIFLGAPLWWDDVHTGYAYSGPLVGAVLGFLVVGGLADWSAKFMTRHNNGVYEPEFRIVLVIPQLIIGSAGVFGFGIVSPNMVEYFWFWPIFFFGLVVMGMVIGAVASALYIVDAHRNFPEHPLRYSSTHHLNRRYCNRGIYLHDDIQEYLLLRPCVQRLQLAHPG